MLYYVILNYIFVIAVAVVFVMIVIITILSGTIDCYYYYDFWYSYY